MLRKFQEVLERSKVRVDDFLGGDVVVQGISQDSRSVKSNDLFIVIPSTRDATFISQVIECGIRAFVLERSTYEKIKNDIDITKISLAIVDNARLALSRICCAWFQKQPKNCIAVTGTNGKSSVVHFVKQILEINHQRAASLGTLGLNVSLDAQNFPDVPSLTTLDAVSLHSILSFLNDHDVDCVAMEASSHGIDQYRLHGVQLTAAAFTNLTQDHLDYHKTMDAYFAAKAKLFSEILPSGQTAVIFRDSDYSKRLLAICEARGHKIIQYSTQKPADIFASNVEYTLQGIESDLHIGENIYERVKIPLLGGFQLENVLCAIGLTLACGVSAHDIVATLPFLKNVKGRMEHVENYKNASIFVDYAHTPDALMRVLLASRSHTKKRLGLVFGCGGDRDPIKRPVMGEIARKYADFVIVTDDNPRTENPGAIRQQILRTCSNAIEIGERSQAIERALELLDEGDILIIAGKGHETGQIIGHTAYPFDDAVCVLDHLERKK